jgi:hypothetical protein
MKLPITFCLAFCMLLGHSPLSAQFMAYHQSNPVANPGAAPSKVPIYAGLGVIVLAGSGMMVAGFTNRTDALDQKELFNTYTNPADQFYTDLGVTRDEFEDSYKKDLKKSNLLIYGGAGVVALGAGILINRIIWINRIERAKANRSGLVPDHNPIPISVTSAHRGTGMGLAYQF